MIGNRPKYNLCKGLTSAFEINGKIYQFINGCLVLVEDSTPPVFSKNFGVIAYNEMNENEIIHLYTMINACADFQISDFECTYVNYYGYDAYLVTAYISGDTTDNLLDFKGQLFYEILGIGDLVNCLYLDFNAIGLEKFNPQFLLPNSVEMIDLSNNAPNQIHDLFIPDEFCEKIHDAPHFYCQIILGSMTISEVGEEKLIDKYWGVNRGVYNER